MKTTVAAIAALIAIASAASAFAEPASPAGAILPRGGGPGPIISDLGTAGTLPFNAKRINNNGQIAGTAGNLLAVWDRKAMAAHTLANTTDINVSGLSDRGQIAGTRRTTVTVNSVGYSRYEAINWDPTDGVKSIGANAYTAGNNDDTVVGTLMNGQPFKYTAGTTSYLLPTGITMMAYGIDHTGDVIFNQQTTPPYKAYLLDSTSQKLMEIPAKMPGYSAYATALNDVEDVAGYEWQYNASSRLTAYRGFIWSPMSGTTYLALPTNYYGSRPVAINNRGVVVGYLYNMFGGTVPAVWTQYGKSAYPLSSLLPLNSGWAVSDVADINEAGTIIGGGYHNGNQRCFMMDPAYPAVNNTSFTVKVRNITAAGEFGTYVQANPGDTLEVVYTPLVGSGLVNPSTSNGLYMAPINPTCEVIHGMQTMVGSYDDQVIIPAGYSLQYVQGSCAFIGAPSGTIQHPMSGITSDNVFVQLTLWRALILTGQQQEVRFKVTVAKIFSATPPVVVAK